MSLQTVDLEERINGIVESNPFQLSRSEYRYVADLVTSRAACNLLVFGVGRDSRLWIEANSGGRTVFLEDSIRWIVDVKLAVPEIDVWPVRYNTRRRQWRELLEANGERLSLGLPPAVTDERWNVILVDGPTGFNDDCPGRMKSLYTASRLAHEAGGADVVVHDCDRPVERAFCERFFHPEQLVHELERTRHYRIRSRGPSSLPRSSPPEVES